MTGPRRPQPVMPRAVRRARPRRGRRAATARPAAPSCATERGRPQRRRRPDADPRPTSRADTGDHRPRRPCHECGGAIAADGYCTTCGAKARSPRDHFTEQPAALGGRRVRPGHPPPPQRGRRRAGRPRRAGQPCRARGLRRGVELDRLRRRQPGRRPGGARRPGAARRRAASGPRPRASPRPRRRSRRPPTRPTTPSSATPSPAARATRPRARSSRRSWTRSCSWSGWVGDSRAYWLPDDRRAVSCSPSTTPTPPSRSRPASPAPRPRRGRRRTRSPGGSASDAPDHTPHTASLDLAAPGLGAGLLRRPVELLLRAAPTWPTWCRSSRRTPGAEPLTLAAPWSTGPTPRAASTTSPWRWPGSTPPGTPAQTERSTHDGHVLS